MPFDGKSFLNIRSKINKVKIILERNGLTIVSTLDDIKLDIEVYSGLWNVIILNSRGGLCYYGSVEIEKRKSKPILLDKNLLFTDLDSLLKKHPKLKFLLQ
jgi:hypothetical protein